MGCPYVILSGGANKGERGGGDAGGKPAPPEGWARVYWVDVDYLVGRCRQPVSKPVLKAHMVSALEAIIR
jgi:hypothetical protein